MPNFKSVQPLFLSVLTGILLILIFPGFELEFLAWVALVPLFFAIENQSLPRAALCGALAGTVFYFGGLSWITHALTAYGHQPPALSWLVLGILVLYMSFYVSLFCYLIKRWSRGDPLFFFMLAGPAWTSLEYLRSTHPEYGFSWLGLGYSQFENLTVIQIAESTGVYGVSALIVMVNAALHYLANAWVFRRGDKLNYPGSLPARVAGTTVVVLCVCLGYGAHALSGLDADGGRGTEPGTLKIALAQGNIEQGQKWDAFYRSRILKTYRDLTLKAAGSGPDLVVWPEAAAPFFFPGDEKGSEALKDLARAAETPLLFGAPRQENSPNGPLLFNSVHLLSPDGKILGRYDKIHLVPFGEFVPFRKLLWFVDKLVEMVGDFGRGEKITVFDLKGHRFAVSICYEIAFPDLVRRSAKEGAAFLVNVTNDAWYGRSAASRQHMSMGALRAAENRTPIVRAANTGISGTIDPSGRIRQATELFVEDLVLAEIVPSRRGPTYYSLYGDVFSYACIATSLALALLARRPQTPILHEDGLDRGWEA